ncbi:MAG: alpha/beta fold hydrolase [Gammaproteobacteria bacterium]
MNKPAVAASVAACILIALATYEFLRASHVAKNFPPPGELVDLGGRNLQIDCRGSGSPVVALETGGQGIFGAYEWGDSFDEIARKTRVCAYSRAGYMWSDSNPSADAESGARDLHAALALASEQAPYVLVSHSRGSFTLLLFSDLFSADVAGLVFVDPTHPDMQARKAAAGVRQSEVMLGSVRLLQALRWTGLPHLYADFCELNYLSAQQIAACKAWFPHSLDGIVSENSRYDAVAARAREVRNLGTRPVIVLTRQLGEARYSDDPAIREAQQNEEELWRSMIAEIAALSVNGEQRIVPDSTHASLMTRPAAMLDAVDDMLDIVRAQSSSGY